jgi:hypothetical protein
MKSILIAASLLVLLSAPSFADIHGAWTATTSTRGPEKIELFMTSGESRQFGESFTPSVLGVSEATLHAATATPVTMKLDRDAGTIVLEGTFKNGDGAGQFTFTPKRSYSAAMKAAGVDFDLGENRSEEDQLFSLVAMDVSVSYVKEMKAIFPETSLREFRKMRALDVTPEYVRSMRAAGVDVPSAHDATKLRAVGVTPEFVAELASAGYRNLSARDLIRMAAVGVNGKFIREMSQTRDRQ